MISGRQETRIQQLLDGELPESAWPEVRELLESSEEARRAYCAHARLRSRLCHMRRERITLAAPAVPVDFMVATQRRRQFRWAGIAAAALILLSGLVMRFVIVRQESATATLAVASNSQFTLTHSSADTDHGNQLREGSRLRLDQGVVEIEFASGVRSVIRGPADLTLVHEGELRLDQGSGWFLVPENAIGFQVTTPRAVITDLGTEFGVITRPDQADSVHLFCGAVRVQSRFGAMESATLRGHEARNITLTGRLEPTAVRREKFFTDLPAALPTLHWSFDEVSPSAWRASGSLPEAVGMKTIPPSGSASPDSAVGRFGQAMQLPTGSTWTTDWPGIPGNAPRTLAFWLKIAPRPDYLHPIAGWGHRYGDYDTTLAAFFAFAETVNGVTVAGASLGGYWIKGKTRIDDNRWHHVAITASGKQLSDGRPDLRLYIDGREEPATPFRTDGLEVSKNQPLVMGTDTTHPDAQPLSVFSQFFARVERGHPFPGSIDELVVVEGVLDPSSIELLTRENLLQSGPGWHESGSLLQEKPPRRQQPPDD